MSYSDPPNLDFGSIEIFFDTHPHEQEGYLYSYWSSLKATLHIAMTGIVPKFHPFGTLRIQWWTHDNNEGMKDYALHEYVLVKQNFDLLANMGDEVRRVVVKGWSGQNPYVHMAEGRRIAQGGVYYANGKGDGKGVRGEDWDRKQKQAFDNAEEGRTGKIIDIEGVIEAHDKLEEERKREADERVWKENEGLLSGGMV